jgi:flagellar biosynthesis component FlhA
MLLHQKNIDLLFYEIDYWLKELDFDLNSYVKNYNGFVEREFKNIVLYSDENIKKIIDSSNITDLNRVIQTSLPEESHRFLKLMPSELRDKFQVIQDLSIEQIEESKLSILNSGRKMMFLPELKISTKEVKYLKSDEPVIFLKALPVEVSIALISIMDLTVTSSTLKRYYAFNLYNKERDILEKFLYNYYCKEINKGSNISTGDSTENIILPEVHHVTLQIGVGLTWSKSKISNTLEELRTYIFEKKGVIIPDLIVSVSHEPDSYVISLGDKKIGEGRPVGNRLLVIEAEENAGLLEGIDFFEPVYGIESVWIEGEEIDRTAKKGFVITSIELIEKNIPLIIDEDYLTSCFQEIKKSHSLLLKRLKEINIPHENIVSILKNLVVKGVNIRDFVTILSEILQLWPRTDDTEVITEHIIESFSSLFCYTYVSEKKLYCFTLPSHIDEELRKTSLWDNLFTEKLPERLKNLFISYLENSSILMKVNKRKPLLVTGRDIKPYIKKLPGEEISNLVVLSREGLDVQIELCEENQRWKDMKYVLIDSDILSRIDNQFLLHKIIWAIKDKISSKDYLFIICPFIYRSFFRNVTKSLPWIRVISEEGLEELPQVKDLINLESFNRFFNIFSLILKEDFEEAEKKIENFRNISFSGWPCIMKGIISIKKKNYHKGREEFMEGLKENPDLINIFPLKELSHIVDCKDLEEKEKNSFLKFYGENLFRKISFTKKFPSPEDCLSVNELISFYHRNGQLLPAELEVQISEKLEGIINNSDIKEQLHNLKIEFMAKKGLKLPSIEFFRNDLLKEYNYSILLKGFAINRCEEFSSLHLLIDDIKEIIYKKPHFFIDINQTEDILGRSRVTFPKKVEKLDNMRIPVDSMWKIFQNLLKNGGSLLNIEPVLEVTGDLWQSDTSLIAEKALEKLSYIDEKNMARGKLYFIWQNKLKEKLFREDIEAHIDYSLLAGIIKDFDFFSFLKKKENYHDRIFSELSFFNKKAWMIILDFADINELVEAFKEAPCELYEHVLSLLPCDTVPFFREVTSQPLIKKSITEDGRINLFNMFRSLVILGKCYFPKELLSSPAWLSLDRLHFTCEREKIINSLTDREKIAIILHNLPEPLSVCLQILFPGYKPPGYHHEISREILEEFYEKYFKELSEISYSSIPVKSFDRVILKGGEKICREDYKGAIDILKEEPENRIAGFLISVLLKYMEKPACSSGYLSETIDPSHILLQYGWQEKKWSPSELGYYLSHTDFYRKYGENYLAACGYRLKGEKNPDSLVFYEQGECYFDAEMYGHAFISYGKSLEWLKRENRYKPSDFMKNLLRKIFHTLYLSQSCEDIASIIPSLPEEKIFPYLKLFSSEENLKKLLSFKENFQKETLKENFVIKEILSLCIEEVFLW